jgi:hypothetical protein
MIQGWFMFALTKNFLSTNLYFLTILCEFLHVISLLLDEGYSEVI